MKFLVCYDYGQGGVWACIIARSEKEIATKYPELKIFKNVPPFLDQETLNDIVAKLTLDIDKEPSGWLATLIEKRGHASCAL